VNENKQDETDAESGAEKSPVDAHECEETKEKFEFKNGEEKSLAFRKENGDGSKGTELAGPTMLFLGRRTHFRGEFELVSLSSNPLGLSRIRREKGKRFEPLLTSQEKLVLLFESFGACRDTQKFFTVDERVTLLACERSQRQGGPAVMAVADWFGVSVGHDWLFGAALGCEWRCWCGGRKRAEDIDLGSSSKAPGNVHTN
jgi:hypothetical protein